MLQDCAVMPTRHLLISAKFIEVYPGYELLGPVPGNMSQCCTGAQNRNTFSWSLSFEEIEEGTVALCRRQTLSDTVYGQ